jgi:hypothetical protein
MRSRPTSGRKERIVFPNSRASRKHRCRRLSAAYQEALQALGNAAMRDLRIVEKQVATQDG